MWNETPQKFRKHSSNIYYFLFLQDGLPRNPIVYVVDSAVPRF